MTEFNGCYPWALEDNAKTLSAFDFLYKWTDDNDQEHKDTGTVTYAISRGKDFWELYIEARSGFTVCIGPKSGGGFCCVPAMGAGAELADLQDIFWNNESLGRVLPPADASAIAYAIAKLKQITAEGLD